MHCPTLLLHGEEDSLAPFEQVHAIFEQVHAPKQLVVVPGAGHGIVLTRTPEVSEQVARFLGVVQPLTNDH